ncbi:PHD-zinc-finger like domain-containing protein [Hirsutella rhossiliensis]|uniref:PHD-zinc-finger like domain-containing protein n=1 Tax=Hirsutella rhossiliensis TaxID=111463 RepID=A0A9P8MZH8_9HYPO|nr:PHD-zinc-finger like domain-containing protein [Hirsutella rhossiliensis]KAH0963164.1 PHD-zinc-finger like domain-containing protein [Hirsutella rhossiliensis]
MAQQNDSKATGADALPASESARASSGSDTAAKDPGAEMAAPYGTRSRNRTSNARPNYAEDKDIDMDNYDFYRGKDGHEGSKKSARHALAAATHADAPPRNGGGSRKSGVDDGRAAGPSQNGFKDQNSTANSGNGGGGGGATGASQAAPPSGASQSSRKRKAAPAGATRRASNAVQSTGPPLRETNMMTFERCNSCLDQERLIADDGTVLELNDHVYLVCEPPGEPYYLGRIMEFLPAQNDGSTPVDSVRVNWFYRPKDIGRKASDTRQLFATMHSDVSPLTALRGKCRIMHRGQVDNMDQFRKTPDSFWFEKLYDRYIQKQYDLIPTSSIVNVPDKVKKVLDDRWKYVLVEQGRGKELTSAVKLCKRCSGYCASNDSVDCAVCHNTYHMNCVRPPLLKKPSRGFAWSCAACSRAQERKLEARNTPNGAGDVDDDEFVDDDDDEAHGISTDRTTPADDDSNPQATAQQIWQASMWPWRYLGMHCKPEDALDYDDRIYPRASTRIGPRHQANVAPWPGRPVQYVKPVEVKKGAKGPKMSKEAQDAEKALRGKRPKWVQDQPPGYVARGEDHDEDDPKATSTLLWRPPSSDNDIRSNSVEDYVKKVQSMAKKLSLPERSTNLRDAALETLFRHEYDVPGALKALPNIEREAFKEPNLTAAEVKKFEEGVSKYGSELHLVMKHVKTMTPAQVVRFYYTWKKTERGQQIWGSFTGRKGKKQAKRAEAAASKFADDVADNDDDSAFDSAKATEKKRCFVCQFCSTTSSRQWRRAPTAPPGVAGDHGAKAAAKDKGSQFVVALCRRCAELWRRYGIRFEEMEEVAKKVAQSGGRAWKRKQDEELLKELQAAQEMGLMTPDRDMTPLSGTIPAASQEPPRKKLKNAPSDNCKDKDKESREKEREKEKETKDNNKDPETACSDGGGSVSGLSKKKDKPADTTPIPEMPKPRTLPCAICDQMEPLGDQHVSCRECRLTVHRNCYGIVDNRIQGQWTCDMCSNDKSPQVSIQYKCVLCPVEHTEKDFVEQPKLTHHKKKMSEKDREREKMEVQQARKAAEYYRKKQEEMNRPVNPREPLKRTADNNWVHVTCAVWTPEVKFGNGKALEPSEGVPSIPRSRYDETCQACNQKGGACVFCHQCRTPYHVECARQHGHLLGFDVTPVKSSRRDQFNIVTVGGESGTMSAVVWCKDHVPTKTVAHRMHDVVSEAGLNALQLYVQNYKQADRTLTGTVRKANLMMNAAKTSGAPAQPGGSRRTSTTTTTMTTAAAVNGSGPHARCEMTEAASNAQQPGDKVCITCGIDVTPKWWPIDDSLERRLTNGHHGVIGSEAQKFVEQRKFQCHKCRKAARTPKPYVPGPSPPASEPPRVHAQANGQAVGVSPLRSPPPAPSDFRPIRPEIHALLHHPASHPPPTPAPAQPPPPPLPPALSPAASSTAAPPHTAAPAPYNDWSHQPGLRHASPPRHLNGGPPSLLNGPPPPMANLSSLRPPAISGPPPVAPLSGGHHHPHGSPLYGNGVRFMERQHRTTRRPA